MFDFEEVAVVLKKVIKGYIFRAFVMLLNAVIISFIVYVMGYIGGTVIDGIMGDRMIEFLNIILGEGKVVKEQIPMLCGMLGVFGNFFRLSAPIVTK